MARLIRPLLLAFVVAAASGQPPAWAGPAEDQYELAAAQYKLGRYQLAAAEFETFLEKFPQHAKAAEANFYLGEALVQLGDFAKARGRFDAFAAAAPSSPYSPRAMFRRGEAAYLTGDYKAARELLTKFAAEHAADPLNKYALPYLGELALVENQPAEAQRYYTEALRQHGDTPLADQCRFGLAKALQMQRRFEDAARFYQFLIDKPSSPLADDSLLQLGRLQHERGEHAAAAETLGKLQSGYPQSELLPYARYWLGVAKLAQNDPASAIAPLEAAAALEGKHPLLPAAQFQLGEALRRAGRADEALARFRQVLQTDGDSPWADEAAHGELRIAEDRGHYESVAALAQQFLEKYPQDPLRFDVRRMLGRAQLKQNQFQQAIATLQPLVQELEAGTQPAGSADGKALGLAAADSIALAQASRYALALALVGAQQHGQALAAISPLKADETKDPQLAAGVAAVKASALLGLKRTAEAIPLLQDYLRLDPSGPDADTTRAQLAMTLADANRFEEAKRIYGELARRHTDRTQFLHTTHYLAERAYGGGEKPWALELFAALADEKNPPEFREKGLAGKAWTELDLSAAANSAQTFETLLKQFPDTPQLPEAALARGAALEQAQKPQDALGMYALVIEKFSGSKQFPQALYRAAKLHEQLGQNEQAAALLARFIQEFPQEPNLDAALYRQGWVLAQLNKPEESAAAFERIHAQLKSSRYWADATYRLAEQAALAGKHEQVARLTDEIAAAGVGDQVLEFALYLRGQSAARAGLWASVAAPMRQLLERFPGTAQRIAAEYWIAESLYQQEKTAEAAQAFEALAQRTQNEAAPWLAIVPLRRAQLLAQQKQWAAAQAMAEGIAARYPQFDQQYEADYVLGRCLFMQAKVSEAREAFQRVVDSPTGGRTETAAKADWYIGETYLHQKDYANAIRAYSRVELLYDLPLWQSAAVLQIGKCYEMQGNFQEAIARYQQLLTQFPDTRFKDEASRRLQVARERAGGGSTATEARSPTANSPR